MPWFKVDDTLPFHAKVVAAGNAAMGLWVRAGAWSSQQLTEGHVPAHIAATMGTRAEAKRLVDSGLWLAEGDGFRFWQWEGRQPTREQVLSTRQASADRQQRARERARAEREASRRDDTVTGDATTPLVTVPPTRPDPTRPKELSKDLGGQRHETLPATDATQPPRCSTHASLPDDRDPGPCVGCKRARESAERVAAARAAAARAALTNCPDCLGSGWIEDADGRPLEHCDHRRTS